MKRILFLTAFNPSKTAAGNNYSRQLLENLSSRFLIDVISFRNDDVDIYKSPNSNIRILRSIKMNSISKIFGVLQCPLFFPLFTGRFRWTLVKYFRTVIKENCYDYIYFDFSQVFIYSLFLNHVSTIHMAHDVIGQKYERKGWFPAWTRWSENKMYAKAQNVFTFSHKDSNLLKEKYGIESTPTSFFLQKESIEAMPLQDNEIYYVFYGAWGRNVNYESLEWFLDNVMPRLDASKKFKIIGRGLPKHVVEKVEKFNNIEQLGFVDNPYQVIANAQALISPLHDGAGVKVKVIESLACGTPIIGTKLSFEGIDDIYSSFMHIAETPEDYMKCICDDVISLDEKRDFKNMFIKTYDHKPILDYLKS